MRTTIVILILWLLSLPTQLVGQALFITEFMAAPQSGEDWVEIYNASTEDVSLEGWYLTDRRTNAMHSPLPSVVLPAKQFLVVNPGFNLAASGEYLALSNPSLGYQHEVGVFPPQIDDISYGYLMQGDAVLTNRPTYLRPTPGQRNEVESTPFTETLFITEFMAADQSCWVNVKGDYEDWVEIYNASSNDVSLEGWYLTDRSHNPSKSPLPNVVLPAKQFLVVNPGFKLGASGDYLSLNNPVRGYRHEVGNFPPQLADVSYGYPTLGEVVLTNQPTYLQPTPGRRNGSQSKPYPLILTELMYQPLSGGPGFLPDERLQFVELKNVGTEPLDLTGYAFVQGISYAFSNQVLAAGERLIVVTNRPAFELHYGANPRIAGEFTGSLKNGGERIILRSPIGEPVVDMVYDQTWQPLADGLGFSLVLKDDTAAPARYDRPELWRNSARPGGSPGLPEPPHVHPRVVINEILARAELPYEDVIELSNLGTSDVDISGWYLSDRRGNPRKFRIPEGTILPGSGYWAFDEHAFNPFEDRASPTSFAFNDFGEEVWLFSADLDGNLTGYAHGFDFGGSQTNVTLGRIVTGTGEERLVPQSAMTFFESNAPPSFGPLVISEINHAIQQKLGRDIQYIELHNITAQPVPLYDPSNPTNRWKLANAVDFTFPETVIPPFGYALVMKVSPWYFEALAYFRGTGSVPNDVPIFGPFSGFLGSSGTIDLVRPDAPIAGVIPYLVVDRLSYSNQTPWPKAPAGFGASLNRVKDHAYGDDPTNWRAALPNPGRALPIGPDPVITAHPASIMMREATNVTLSVTATGQAPSYYQWAINGFPISGANEPTITVPSWNPRRFDTYSCQVTDAFGSTSSSNAVINPDLIPLHDTSPPSLNVLSPENSTVIAIRRSLTISGEALADDDLAGIFVQQDDGPLLLLSETTNWNFTASLDDQHTSIRLMAMDRAGNVSHTNIIEISLATNMPAALALNGSGFFRGLTNGQLLAIGSRYSVTATPVLGQLFSHWTDENGNVVSTNQTHSFVAALELVLTANFSVDERRAPALIAVHGGGTVQGVTNGQSLRIGSRYTAKARPAPGQLFVHWTDGNGAALSSHPAFSFTASNGVRLVATFVENSHFLPKKGAYIGLLFDPDQPEDQPVGSIDFTVSRTGQFTGRTRLGARTQRFAGGLDAELFTRLVLARGTAQETMITLQLGRDSDAFTGTFSNALAQTSLAGSRTMSPGGKAGEAWAGTYLLPNFPAPDPTLDVPGAFDLAISPAGRYLLRGRLPDGVRVAQRGTLTTAGSVLFHAPLQRGESSLTGWLNITPAAQTNASGWMLWSRTASATQAEFHHWLPLEGTEMSSAPPSSPAAD